MYWGYNPLILTFYPNFQQNHPSRRGFFSHSEDRAKGVRRDHGNLRNGMLCRFQRWNVEHCKIANNWYCRSKKWRMWTFNLLLETWLVRLVSSEVWNLMFIVHLGFMVFFQVKFVMSDALFDLAASSKATIRRVSSILPNRGRKCSYRRNRGGEGLKKW